MKRGERIAIWIGGRPNQCSSTVAVPLGSLIGSGYARNIVMQDLYLDPIDSLEELIEAERVTVDAFHNEFLNYVVDCLSLPANAHHKHDFWSIVLAPWLLFIIQTCYLNYRLLQKYIAQFGNENADVIIFSRHPFMKPPATAEALVDILLGVNFHIWVIGQYLPAIKPCRWNINLYESQETAFAPVSHMSLFKKIKARIRKQLAKLRCTSEQVPLTWQIQFSLLLEFRKVAHNFERNKTRAVMPTLEVRCATSIPSDFIAMTKVIISECLPNWYRQDFSEHYKQVANKKYRVGYGRIVSSNIYDDEANLIKAMAAENGEIVFCVQHGGGFGTHKVFCLSPESEYLGGPFITWGWREHESYHVDALPLPSPQLSRLRVARSRTRVGDDIVFVGADMSPLKLRVHSKPIGSQWLDYRQQKIAFLNELSNEAVATVLYRGYNTGVLDDDEFLWQRFPTLRLERGSYRDFHRRLKSARLCLVDHPITTLHQALAMNIPTVAYWNHNHWTLSIQATPWFAELESVGIVHHSGEEAGKFVNENFNRIESWWGAEEVQSIRQRWCHVYAQTSDCWIGDWLQAIWGANNGS